MLSDDELDFDNFSDLGEYDGEINTDELEKELELELNDALASEDISDKTKVEDDIPDKKDAVKKEEPVEAVPTVVDKTKKEESTVNETKEAVDVKKTDDEEKKIDVEKKIDAEKKEEGEMPKDDVNNNEVPVNQKNTSQPRNPHVKGYNNNNNYNYYGYPNPNFIPPAFPYVAPFHSNKIYVNPKFNKGGQNQFNQHPAMQQQLQYMNAQQLMMQQYQLHQQLMDVEQKRIAAAEAMKRRQESKEDASSKVTEPERRRRYQDEERRPATTTTTTTATTTSSGVKRERSNDDDEMERRQVKRTNHAPILSIRGAASRLNASSSPLPPQPKRDITSRVGLPSISSRLGRPKTNERRRTPSPPARSSPIVPIATNGKSNSLVVKGLSDEDELRKMASSVPGGASQINVNTDTKTATISFANVESAVTFRRKYNRLHVGDAHLNIAFKK